MVGIVPITAHFQYVVFNSLTKNMTYMKQKIDPLRLIADGSGEHRRRQHSTFLKFSTREGRYGTKRIDRTIGKHRAKSGFVSLERAQEQLLETKLCIYPEYLAATHDLEGCPRQLFNYIIAHELNPLDNTYLFNEQTISRFKEYCSLLSEKRHTDATIRKANRILVEKNIIQNVKRGLYMVNPLFACCSTQDMRRMLINKYSLLLIDKGKSAILDFLPVYETPMAA